MKRGEINILYLLLGVLALLFFVSIGLFFLSPEKLEKGIEITSETLGEKEITQGTSFLLEQTKNQSIMLGGREHHIELNEILLDEVRITTYPQKQTFTLKKGEEQEIDLNQDGQPDIFLQLESITNNQPQLFIRRGGEQEATETSTLDPSSESQPNVSKESANAQGESTCEEEWECTDWEKNVEVIRRDDGVEVECYEIRRCLEVSSCDTMNDRPAQTGYDCPTKESSSVFAAEIAVCNETSSSTNHNSNDLRVSILGPSDGQCRVHYLYESHGNSAYVGSDMECLVNMTDLNETINYFEQMCSGTLWTLLITTGEDCGSDMGCLEEKIPLCAPGTGIIQKTLTLNKNHTLLLGQGLTLSASGSDCRLREQNTSVEIRFTNEHEATLLAEGLTQEQINAAESSNTSALTGTIGGTQDCIFTKTALETVLDNWNAGTFSLIDEQTGSCS